MLADAIKVPPFEAGLFVVVWVKFSKLAEVMVWV
jgi:hypothetical protein